MTFYERMRQALQTGADTRGIDVDIPIAMVMGETGWGKSSLLEAHNFSGMSTSEPTNYARPADEGGYYKEYGSDEEWANDYWATIDNMGTAGITDPNEFYNKVVSEGYAADPNAVNLYSGVYNNLKSGYHGDDTDVTLQGSDSYDSDYDETDDGLDVSFPVPIIDHDIEDVGLEHTSKGLRHKVDALNTWVHNTYGRDLMVTGGWRSPEHNAEVNGAEHSHHLTGDAIDVSVEGFNEQERQEIIAHALAMGFNSDGEDIYHDKGSGYHLHLEFPGLKSGSGHGTVGRRAVSAGDYLHYVGEQALLGGIGLNNPFGFDSDTIEAAKHFDTSGIWKSDDGKPYEVPPLLEGIWHDFKKSNLVYAMANAFWNDLFYSEHNAQYWKPSEEDKKMMAETLGGDKETAEWIANNVRDKTQMMRVLQQKKELMDEEARYADYYNRIGGHTIGAVLGAVLDPISLLAPELKVAQVGKALATLKVMKGVGFAVRNADKIEEIANLSAKLAESKMVAIPTAMSNAAAQNVMQDYLVSKANNEDPHLAQAALMGGIAGGVLHVMGGSLKGAYNRYNKNHPELEDVATAANRVEYSTIRNAAGLETPHKVNTEAVIIKAGKYHDQSFIDGTSPRNNVLSMATKEERHAIDTMVNNNPVFTMSQKNAKKLATSMGIQLDRGAKAFFDPNTKATVVITDHIKSPSEMVKVLQHEVAVHSNLKDTIGDNAYNSLMSQIEEGRKVAGSVWAKAGTKLDTSDPEELLGYAIEHNMLDKQSKSSIVSTFKNGLRNMVGGEGKRGSFSDKEILDMVQKAGEYSRQPNVDMVSNADGSVMLNGVKYSKNNLVNPNTVNDVLNMADEQLYAKNHINNALTEAVGRKMDNIKPTRTVFGAVYHDASPTASKIAPQLFEDAQLRGAKKVSPRMPSAERQREEILQQINMPVQRIEEARQNWMKETYGVGAYLPYKRDSRRLIFDRAAILLHDHNVSGHTLNNIDDPIFSNPNVIKAAKEIEELYKRRVELGKKSSNMFGGKEEYNLIEKGWTPVDNAFHRVMDDTLYNNFFTHFLNKGDDGAKEFLKDYIVKAADKAKVREMMERELELHPPKDTDGSIPKITDKDVLLAINEKADSWIDNFFGKATDMSFDTGATGTGHLNFLQGRLPMDTGMMMKMPDGEMFSFDNNLRYYDLSHILNRTNNRFAGEAALKTTFGEMDTTAEKLLSQTQKEREILKGQGRINQSEVSRMHNDFEDSLKALAGKRSRKDELTETGALLRILKNTAYFKHGGMMGFSQFGDVGNAMAYGGKHMIFSVFKPLRNFVDDIRLGKVTREDLEKMNLEMFGADCCRKIWDTNWGDQVVRNALSKDSWSSRGLTMAADVTKDLGKFTTQISQIQHMTDSMMNGARMNSFREAVLWANGKEFNKSRNPFSKAKLNALGRPIDVNALKADIQKYVNWTGKAGERATFDKNAWIDESPKTYWQFKELIQNQANRMIQEDTSLGATNQLARDSSLYSLLMQFKNFSFRANNAQTMRALRSHDLDDGIAFGMSLITNLGAYAARQGLKIATLMALGQTEQAQYIKDNYLNDKALAKAAFLRSGFMSPLSNANDVYEAATGSPSIRTTVSDKQRQAPQNAGDVIGNFLQQTPALDTLDDMTRKPIAAAYALSDGRGSQRDVRTMMDLLPVPDFMPYSQALDTLSKIAVPNLPANRPKVKSKSKGHNKTGKTQEKPSTNLIDVLLQQGDDK